MRSETEAEQPDLKITAEFTLMRTTILNALQPFPQARVAVAAALSRATLSRAQVKNNAHNRESSNR
jgi:hypothetical protein